MKWLLDTNAVIAIVKHNPKITQRVRSLDPVEFGISSIVAHELYFGIYKSERHEENLTRFERLRLAIVEFDREDAHVAGVIRAALALVGSPIGPYDVLIAGQAKARNLILITRNVREFDRVGGLHVENWE